MRLKSQLALVVALPMTALVLCYSALMLSQAHERADSETLGTMPWVLALLPEQASPDQLPGIVATVVRLDGIRHVTIKLYGPQGQLLARAPAQQRDFPSWLPGTKLGSVPVRKDIHDGQRLIAFFEVTPAAADELMEIWEDFARSASLTLLLSFLTIALMVGFSLRALRPLELIRAGLREVGAGQHRRTSLPRFATAEMNDIAVAFERMASDLRRAHEERQSLMRSLLESEEDTRRQLAHDLHDELSPYLIALQPIMHTLERQVDKHPDLAFLAPSVRTMADHQGRILATLRRILAGLHPAELDTMGLRTALQMLVEHAGRHDDGQVVARLHLPPDRKSFGRTVDVSVYRMVMECLTNARRHANPRRIDVRLSIEASAGETEQLLVEVTNDGSPLSDEPGRSGLAGLGILGMRERCAALGGSLASGALSPGQWRVEIRLPVPSRPGTQSTHEPVPIP